MNGLLDKFLERTEFSSYRDMKQNYRLKYPDNYNFAYDVLEEWARTAPDKPALLWTNPEGEEKRFSFADINAWANRVAHALRDCGVGKGDVITLIMKRRWEFWPTIMACHKIGAVVIPVNHLMKKKDFVYRFNTVDVKAVVCVNENMVVREIEQAFEECPGIHTRILAGGSREGWKSWDELTAAASPEWNEPRPAGGRDLMLMYFTSGTTGFPKVVAHDYLYSLGHIVTARYWQRCRDGGLHLTVSDTGWGKSVWGKLYGQWICGTCVFVYDYDRFNAHELLSLVEKYRITSFCAPPTIYRFFVKEDLSRYDFSHLEHVTTAGEALHPEVFNVFEKATGKKIYEAYGQTETVAVLGTFEGVEPRPGSMGVASPQFDVDTIDADFNPTEDGEDGDLVIRLPEGELPPGLLNCYYNDTEMIKEKIRHGFFFTGDMAWRDEDGYFWFVGRSDDIIKTSGYRVGPFEIESVLMEHPSVLECAITGAPDPIRGQVVKATVVLARGYTPSDDLANELKDYVKKNTAPYKYPRIIEFIDEMPKTISGKIRRVELREKDEKDEASH